MKGKEVASQGGVCFTCLGGVFRRLGLRSSSFQLTLEWLTTKRQTLLDLPWLCSVVMGKFIRWLIIIIIMQFIPYPNTTFLVNWEILGIYSWMDCISYSKLMFLVLSTCWVWTCMSYAGSKRDFLKIRYHLKRVSCLHFIFFFLSFSL